MWHTHMSMFCQIQKILNTPLLEKKNFKYMLSYIILFLDVVISW